MADLYEEQRGVLQRHIVDLLTQLERIRGTDGETMFMIGNLAGRMLLDSRLAHWNAMKDRLSAMDYDQLLLTTQKQGQSLFKEGDVRAAFALDVIITSIVGSRFADPGITEGVALLDQLIERTISNWRLHNAPPPVH